MAPLGVTPGTRRSVSGARGAEPRGSSVALERCEQQLNRCQRRLLRSKRRENASRGQFFSLRQVDELGRPRPSARRGEAGQAGFRFVCPSDAAHGVQMHRGHAIWLGPAPGATQERPPPGAQRHGIPGSRHAVPPSSQCRPAASATPSSQCHPPAAGGSRHPDARRCPGLAREPPSLGPAGRGGVMWRSG
jgi:hypothetical protein